MAHSKRSFLALAALLAFSTSAMSMDMIGNCELSGVRGSIPIPKTAASPAKRGVDAGLHPFAELIGLSGA